MVRDALKASVEIALLKGRASYVCQQLTFLDNPPGVHQARFIEFPATLFVAPPDR